jgi:hypothetical protein
MGKIGMQAQVPSSPLEVKDTPDTNVMFGELREVADILPQTGC